MSNESAAKRIHSARAQYQAMFRQMAASGCAWNLHKGSAAYVLLIDGAQMDADLPVVLRHVESMSEQQMAARLSDADRTQVWSV